MKIRNGFVSNSSSSSFILQFTKKPESFSDLKSLVFPDENNRVFFNKDTITLSLWEQVREFFELPEEEQTRRLLSELKVLAHLNSYDYNTINMNWDEQDKKAEILCKEYFNSLPKDKVFAIVGYSDNDGEDSSFMEHSDVFDSIVYKKISHH